MRALIFLLCVAGFAVPALAQVNRCKMPDGRVVYSDTECPSSSTDSKNLVKPAPREWTGGGSQSSTAGIQPGKMVQFSGTPRTDYIKASALLDNIRVIGRDCEWALKVDKSQMQKCKNFLGRLSPNGEYSQIIDHVTMLNKDQSNMRENSGEIRSILRISEDIVRYKEFMLANLGVR